MTKLELRRVGKPRDVGPRERRLHRERQRRVVRQIAHSSVPERAVYRAGSLHPSKRAHASKTRQSGTKFQYGVYRSSRTPNRSQSSQTRYSERSNPPKTMDHFSPNVGHDGDGDGRVDSRCGRLDALNGNFRQQSAGHSISSRLRALLHRGRGHDAHHQAFIVRSARSRTSSFVPRHLSKAWRLVAETWAGA